MRRAAEIDATLVDLAGDKIIGTPDLLVLYLPGLDIVQHALFENQGAGTLGPSVAADRLAALERYYVFLDESLATFPGEAGDRRLVVLVTQPGRVERPGAGLIALSGPDAGTAQVTAPPTGVAPTVLHALGLPIARDLASSPLLELFARPFVESRPVRQVVTYGARRSTVRTGSGEPLDREMIERMRSLGYVR